MIFALTNTIQGCVSAWTDGKSYFVTVDGSEREAADQEVTAARAMADKAASDDASLKLLQTQAKAALSRLQEIQSATGLTNLQVVQMVKDLAQIQERVIRVVFKTLT